MESVTKELNNANRLTASELQAVAYNLENAQKEVKILNVAHMDHLQIIIEKVVLLVCCSR